DAARFGLQMRVFCRYSDFQCFQTVFTCYTRSTILQGALGEVPYLPQVRVRESTQEMIGQRLACSIRIKENCRRLLQCSDQNRPFRTDNLGSDVVAINGLNI